MLTILFVLISLLLALDLRSLPSENETIAMSLVIATVIVISGSLLLYLYTRDRLQGTS